MNSDQTRDEVLSSLRNLHLQAVAIVAAGGVAVPSSVQNAALGALRADDGRIDDLDRLSPLVMSGKYSQTKWLAKAQLVWEDIVAQVAYFGEALPTFNRLWYEVVVVTAGDIKEGAASIASAGVPILALVVVALVAIAVIKVT